MISLAEDLIDKYTTNPESYLCHNVPYRASRSKTSLEFGFTDKHLFTLQYDCPSIIACLQSNKRLFESAYEQVDKSTIIQIEQRAIVYAYL